MGESKLKPETTEKLGEIGKSILRRAASRTGAGVEGPPIPEGVLAAEPRQTSKVEVAEGGPEIVPETKRPENVEQTELDRIINDFWAKRSQIEEVRAKKTNRFTSLAKSLGIETRNLDDDPEVMGLEKESDDKYRELMASGIKLYVGDEAKLKNFLDLYGDKEYLFAEIYNRELKARAEIAGFPESVLARFHEIGKSWSELKKWQQIAIGATGGALMTAGAVLVGAGTFGALALTAGYRWGFRGFGAIAMGIGRKVLLEKKQQEAMDAEGRKEVKEIMEILAQHEHDIDAGIAVVVDRKSIADVRRNYKEQNLKNTRQVVKLATKTFIISSLIGESLRLGSQLTGINVGSIIRKIGGYVGLGGGGTRIPAEALGIKGHGGGPPMVEGSPASGGVKPSALEEWAQKNPATGAKVQVPDASLKVAELEYRELGYNKVGPGGGIERSAQTIIKTNPKEFGLDPNDPNFKSKVGKMAHRLTRGLADKFGMNYEKLNEIASHKVQVGDEIRIYKDPATGKFNLTYNGAAFDDALAPKGSVMPEAAEPKVSQGEISKPRVAPEEMKVKTGPVEYPTQKTASQIQGMEEIEAKQKLAQQKYARAVQTEEYLARLHERQGAYLESAGREAHLRQVLATRGLLNRIIEGAGIGNNVSFWEGSALDWHDKIVNVRDYVAQDVQMADEVNKLNLNLGQLKELFLKLGKPELGQSMGDYLKKAMENSRNIELINQIISKK